MSKVENQIKTDEKMPEIVVTIEGILYLQVCTTIPPERIDEIPDKVFDLKGSPGTSHGRWELVDFKEEPNFAPVRCAKYKDRWHYMLNC